MARLDDGAHCLPQRPLRRGLRVLVVEVRQSTAVSTPTRRFVGGLEPYPFDTRLVLWLLGDTTYRWLANHPARIDPVSNLDAPGPLSLGSPDKLRVYGVHTEPLPGYQADHVSISRSLGRDSSPVPTGAVILWPQEQPPPEGWSRLDNPAAGTTGQLAPGLVCIRKMT